MNILLIEDDILVVNAIEGMLAQLKHVVTPVMNAQAESDLTHQESAVSGGAESLTGWY
jgi:CheY-like chemotaxis protein